MPIQLDPFQIKAIECIDRNSSVFVSAPTGAGKTLIAERAIEKAITHGERAIYTAPIKALSNQKYRDFKARFGESQVGILTGDVSINTDASILIMTTEIYRNSLFDASERIKEAGWVIFDEIHYLDDPERGTVWEEAILFTPERIRILALSATIPNVHELTDWIASIHHRPISVIEESHRPVPLQFIFHCQGKFFNTVKELKTGGFYNQDTWKISYRQRQRGFRAMKPKANRLDHMLAHLRQQARLPMIYFAFGRRRAESLAFEASDFDFLNAEEKQLIRADFSRLLERYDLQNEPTAEELAPLVERGIAFHHAGMLPTLKEVVEQLFTSRLIKAIFTTETFALGINMPARSVVFDELEKFYGSGFKTLSTRDFYQMAGRAGRRGMDEKGFVYMRIFPNTISIPELERIIYGVPEKVSSQLNTAYATLLNLYRELGEKLLEIYPRTFHYFQSHKKKREDGYQMLAGKLKLLREMNYLSPEGLTLKGEFAATLFGHELILSEMHESGELDNLDEVKLNVLLSSLIFEPRKGDQLPRLDRNFQKLEKMMQHYHLKIHKHESKLKVSPYTRPPHFHLTLATAAWTNGSSFDDLFRLTGADEGELVRYFRMVIQLLRELYHAPHTSAKLKHTAFSALKKMNRDVVDAEKQLRI